MSAEVVKIKSDVESTPEMILGMLRGYDKRMKAIAAVVIWDDDSYQFINCPMSKSDLAFALAIFQKSVAEEI